MKDTYSLKEDGFSAYWFEGRQHREKAVIWMHGSSMNGKRCLANSLYLREAGCGSVVPALSCGSGAPDGRTLESKKGVKKEVMSIIAKMINLGVRMSGMKKKYSLPEDQFLAEVRKMNRTRGFYMPNDKKAVYKKHVVMGRECLIVQKTEKRAPKAILYFFGGGMMIGPDKGDVDVIVKLVHKTDSDVWFPMYPLCIDNCITDAYEMAYECYRQMIELYGAGNVSTCGFSSGGALAMGIAAYNNTMKEKLPMPRHIVAVSPGEVPWNDAERAIMQANNPKDMMVDYAFMEKVEKYEKQGREDVPEFMIHISRGDLSGVDHIHFVYSTDEVLYGAKQNFIDACNKYGVKYTIRERPGMIHCYAMLPYFRESKEDFEEIAQILAK